MTAKTKRAVVVTTEHRGVFFGNLNGAQVDTDQVLTLTDVQMCVYWSADVRGVLGLAAAGPSKSCKVTPAVPRMVLQGVTSVMDASPEAVKAWAERPWR